MTIRVPPSKRETIGKAHLKEALTTSDPKEAELLKWAVIDRLKKEIAGVREDPAKDILINDAMAWRASILHEAKQVDDAGGEPWNAVLPSVVTDKAEAIEEKEGSARARLFADVAFGHATPLAALVDAWLKERGYAGRTDAAFRHAVKQLSEWCQESDVPQTLQAFDRKTAGKFITERFIERGTDPATANKNLTGLRSYWTWLIERGHVDVEVSPWTKQSVKRTRRGSNHDSDESKKRPFRNDEVRTLLDGTKEQTLMGDFILTAALTGMRRDEIARLQVKHIKAGVISVPGTKTAAARRDVPIHPDLQDLFARRTTERLPEAFLFDELPDQTNEARGRGAPISQAFTRLRRKLEVEDKDERARQSRVDLHSFRRWFIRRAVEALEEGAKGFTAWTIADVVGHSKEDGPLPMTMGRYPGKANVKALRACIESVRLPPTMAKEND